MDPYRTEIQISDDKGFVNLLVHETKEYVTSYYFPQDKLPYGEELYSRVRYCHDITGTSEWSDTVSFSIIIPATIVGVMLDGKNLYWINEKGNKIDSIGSHPTLAACTSMILDVSRDQPSVVRIPLFYIKTAVTGIPGTDSAGKKCWWISDKKILGFRPHPAFKRAKDIVSNYIYIGSTLGFSSTVDGYETIGSGTNQTVLAGKSLTNYKSLISNRNRNGETGWIAYDIWYHAAIRLLHMIQTASNDSQTKCGTNSSGIAFPTTGSTSASIVLNHANGAVIHDLWHCYCYYLDKILIDTDGTLGLYSPIDSTSISSNIKLPTSDGWISDILSGSITIGSDTHDLMELFLPKSVTNNESDSPWYDYYYFYPSNSDRSVLGGSSQNYTERYIETGTKNIYYYAQYGTSCPKRSYVDATLTSWYNKYGTSCSRRSYVAAVTQTYGTNTPCGQYRINSTYLYQNYCGNGATNGMVFCYSSGSLWLGRMCATSTSAKNITKTIYYYTSTTNKTSVTKTVSLGATGYHSNCSSYPYYNETNYGISCSAYGTSTCAITSGGATTPAYYKCSQSGTKCATSSCPYEYSHTDAYYKCSLTGGTCAEASCTQLYKTEPTSTEKTRTTDRHYRSHGIFSLSAYHVYPSDNLNHIACRICKIE